jgi:hypothetical protein
LEPYLCGALFAIIPWAGEKEVHSSPSVRSHGGGASASAGTSSTWQKGNEDRGAKEACGSCEGRSTEEESAVSEERR